MMAERGIAVDPATVHRGVWRRTGSIASCRCVPILRCRGGAAASDAKLPWKTFYRFRYRYAGID